VTKKTLTYEATLRLNENGARKGVTVASSDGSREYLRAESVPAARKALREGTVQPWVKVALEEFDRLA
jgi:hypothetical protein